MRRLLLVIGLMISGAGALAEQPTGAYSVSGEVALVSDYRWRGVSMTNGDPALQAEAYVSHSNGLYAGIWASVPTVGSEDTEISVSIGNAFSWLGGDVDLFVEHYIYPELDDSDYTNLAASFSRPVGRSTVTARMEYAPAQSNLEDESVYAALESEHALGNSGLSLTGSVGWEQGYFTLDGTKWDYAVGAKYQWGPARLGLSYVGTDEDVPPGAGDVYGSGFVFSLGAEF